MDSRVQLIRNVIDALACAERASNDEKEVVFDRELAKIAQMDRTNVLEIANRAIGKDRKRTRYSPYIFSELHDVPGIEEVFKDLLANSDANGRSAIIQTIGLRNLKNLVPTLNSHFAKETDDFCRVRLLTTLAKIAHPSSLPIFDFLINQDRPSDEWLLLVAAKNYDHEVFEPFAKKIFASSTSKKSHKIMAAWTLAKSGNTLAYKYLIEMLDDPEVTTESEGITTYDPGESLRAAQAIAEIYGWDFEWGVSQVALVKRRLANPPS